LKKLIGSNKVRISVFGRAQFVVQVSNLPYRGFPIRTRSQHPEPADWKSAIRQTGSLRYQN
jgi:hypothetical protein